MTRLAVTLSICFLVLSASVYAQVGTWSQQGPLPPFATQLYDIEMVDTQVGYAVGNVDLSFHYSGILKTTNGGVNWFTLPSDPFSPSLPSYTVWRCVSAPDAQTVYVAGDSAMVYKSNDGGNTWQQVFLNLRSASKYAFRPTFRDIYFINRDQGVVVGGDSPSTMPPPPPPPPPPSILPPNPSIIYSTDDGGLTNNDESPTGLYANPALYSVGYKNGMWLATGEFGCALVRSAGNWLRMTLPPDMQNMFIRGQSFDGNNLIVLTGEMNGTNLPRAVISINGGGRWFTITPSSLPSAAKTIAGVSFLSQTNGWLGVAQDFFGATTNSGGTWTKFQTVTMPAPGMVMRMTFLDSLNGWACGMDTATGSTWIVRYSGVPPKADISTTSASMTFPEITCEPYSEQTVTIRNTGTGDLVIQSGDISFSSPEYTTQGVAFPLRIAPFKGKSVTIRWTPGHTTAGIVSGTMFIRSNDGDHSPWPIALLGRRNYGALGLDTLIEVYAEVCLRDTVETMRVGSRIGNLSPTFLRMDYLSGDNEFRLISPKPGTVINGSEQFLFRFSPQTPGLRRGIYRIIAGSVSCPDTFSIALQGFGSKTDITPNVTEVDFGKVCVNTLHDTTLTLTNTGNTMALIYKYELKSGPDMFPSQEPIPILLQPDSVKRYRLRFAPTLTGKFTTEYRIITSPCNDTMIVRLKGESISTEITIIPRGGITVGPTIVGRTVIRKATVQNTGKTMANITLVRLTNTFPDLTISGVPPLPYFLPPGGSFEVTFTYTPQNLGTLNTRLQVAWNSICPDTAAIDVIAPCLPNPVIDAPAAIDMGVQQCPQPIRKTVYIRNRGNGPLLFNSLNISGPDASNFHVVSPVANDSIRAKDSIRLVIEYNRPTAGPSSAGLYLNHTDFDRTPTYIALTGQRTVAEYSVSGDSTTEFFTRLFVPQTRTFTIRNISAQPLNITGIGVLNDTSVIGIQNGPSLPKDLAPGQTATFDVVFTPNARGPFHPTIQVTSQPCGTTWLLTLNGRGDTDGLSVNRGTIDYKLDACEFAALCDTLILSNQGRAAVTVLGANLVQTNPVFSVSSPFSPPLVLQPGQEYPLLVCADPSYFGKNAATLELRSNDPVYPLLKVQLYSQRDSANIAVSASSFDFGRMVKCSTEFTKPSTVTNTGALQEIVSVGLAQGSAFTLSVTGTVPLLPGRSFPLSVTFTRPSAGIFDDTLLVSTKRCPQVQRIPIHAEWIDQSYTAVPQPLSFPTVNIGASSTRAITLQNNGGLDARISSVTVQPSGEFSIVPGYPTAVISGNPVSIQFRFAPQSVGPKSTTACIIFDMPCQDTVCVSLEGSGVRGTIQLNPPALSFGARAQCEQVDLYDTLRNTGNGSIVLQSTSLGGPGASAFSNLTPLTAPDTIAPGSQRVFHIRFAAALVAVDGPVSATLTIVTNDPVQPIIDIPLDAVRQTLVPAAGASVSFGIVEISTPQQRIITLQNNGTAQYCYTASQSDASLSFTPALPLCIDPGQSRSVTVTFLPTSSGPWTGRLSLLVAVPCTDSTVYSFDAQVQQGALTQTPSAFDFESMPWCLADTATVDIQNMYLEDASLDSIRFTGPDAVYFSVLAPVTFPHTIAQHGSTQVVVRFAGVNANRNYTASLVSYFTIFGQKFTRQTALTSMTVSPALAVTPVDFGSTILGQPPIQRSTTITNTSSLPVNVSSVIPSDASFTIVSTVPPIPATLQPGQSITVLIEFQPTIARAYADSLIVGASAPCTFAAIGSIKATVLPLSVVRIATSIGTFSGKPDDHIFIPVLIDKDLGGAQVASWSGSISFNHSMLYPLGVVRTGTLSSNMNVSMTYAHDSGIVHLNAQGGSVLAGTGALIYVECLVLIGNDLQSPLRILPDFDFTSGYATVISRTEGVFSLTGYCFNNGRLITDQPFNMLAQNHPNPVIASTGTTTSITFSIASDGYVTLSLFDIMGREVASLVSEHRNAGTYTIPVDLHGLPEGVYLYTLKTAAFAASRTLVFTR